MNDRTGYDEALPWLEPVDDEDEPRGVSGRKMFAALMMVGLAVAIVVGTMFIIGRERGGSGPPELIRAEAGPYKIKPTDPGGLDVAGDSGTAFATGAGEDQDSKLDVGKMSEPPPPPLPVAGEEKKVVVPPPPPKPVPVVAEATPAAPGATGPTVQLGAYGSTAKAETAWRMLSSRFPAVAGLSKQIVPYSSGVRLRAGAASTEQAKTACAAVTAGGENCFVVR